MHPFSSMHFFHLSDFQARMKDPIWYHRKNSLVDGEGLLRWAHSCSTSDFAGRETHQPIWKILVCLAESFRGRRLSKTTCCFLRERNGNTDMEERKLVVEEEEIDAPLDNLPHSSRLWLVIAFVNHAPQPRFRSEIATLIILFHLACSSV